MKTIITTFSILILFISSVIAQPFSVGYNINLQYNCEDGSKIFIDEGSINEGEQIEFPQYIIPEEYKAAKQFQKFLDLFAGTIVEIPEGTLNENVTFQIAINPVPCDFDDIDIKQLFGITFLVIGSNTGAHLPLDYYHFNEGKKAVIKIKSLNLWTFLKNENLSIEKIGAWFINNNLEEDLKGISFHWSFDSMEYAEIHAEHFSKIIIGSNSSATLVEEEIIPNNYKLDQNYPNPFNPSTTISFSIPKDGHTKLSVYNFLGVEVASLLNEKKTAGNYNIKFNNHNLPSGVYFYELESGNFKNTKKMILLK